MATNVNIGVINETDLSTQTQVGKILFTETGKNFIVKTDGSKLQITDIIPVSALPTIGIENKLYILTTNYSLNYCDTSWHLVGESNQIVIGTSNTDTTKLFLDISIPANPVLKWHNGTSWVNVNNQRNFTTTPIDLTSEVIGILPITKVNTSSLLKINDSGIAGNTTEVYSVDKVLTLLSAKQDKIIMQSTQPLTGLVDKLLWIQTGIIPLLFWEYDLATTTFKQIGSNGGTSLTDWIASTSYTINTSYTIYNSLLYRCITTHTSTATFDITKWQVLSCNKTSQLTNDSNFITSANIKAGTNVSLTTDGNNNTTVNVLGGNATSINSIVVDDSTRVNGSGLFYNSTTGKYENAIVNLTGVVGSSQITTISNTTIPSGTEATFSHPTSSNIVVSIEEQIAGSSVTDTHVDFSDSSKYVLQDSTVSTIINNKSQLKDIETIADTYWNPSDKGTNVVLSNNNLTAKVTGSASYNYSVRSNKYVTVGKHYFEVKIDGWVTNQVISIGVCSDTFSVATGSPSSTTQLSYYGNNGVIYPAITAYGASITTGDVLGVAMDIDNKTIKFSKNGVWYSSLTLPTWTKYYTMLTFGSSSTTTNATVTANYGATVFSYISPSGYLPIGFKASLTPSYSKTTGSSNFTLTTTDTITSLTLPVITPTNTSVKFLFSVDNGVNWLYRSSGVIYKYTGDLTTSWTNSNTNVELQTYFTNLSMTTLTSDLVSLGITPICLDFAWQFITTDAYYTPSVSSITMVYTTIAHTEFASYGSYDETSIKFGIKRISNSSLAVKNLSTKSRIIKINLVTSV